MQRILEECKQYQAKAGEREEEQKQQRANSAKFRKQAQILETQVDTACDRFDNMKAMQSSNCDRAAALAMGEVRRMGANPGMLLNAKRGVDSRSLSSKR